MSLNVEAVRRDFPILQRKINGHPLIYLDNAATTQKPRQVIDAVSGYYENHNANIHRAVHTLGTEATEMHEKAREKVSAFINASPKETIFTRNATEALNLAAHSLSRMLEKGDEIIATVMEHHSNLVPWQSLEAKGAKVKYADINNDGTLSISEIEKLVTKKTKIVAVTHASNVTGVINPIKHISQIAHDAGALVVVDGAQGAPHMPIDVKELGVDFYAFSGHKMLGPTGSGVLYGKASLLEKMHPFLLGGDMIKEVYLSHTTFNDIPYKFEAGTPDIAGAIGLGTAVDYLNGLDMKNIQQHEKDLTNYALKRMQEINGMRIYGPLNADMKTGVVSFNLADVHSHDVASLLDEKGIAIRSGHNCAMPLVQHLAAGSVCRASFYVYNTMQEIDNFISALDHVKKVFRVK